MQIIKVDELYLSVNDFANKHQTGAFVSPDEFNRMMVDEVYSFVRKCYGLEDQYQPGSPVPKISYELTQLVVDYLEKLKVAEYEMKIDQFGKGAIPDNYLHKGAARYLYFKKGDPIDAPAHICNNECPDNCQQGTKSLTYDQTKNPTYTPMNRPVKFVTEEAYEFALCSVNRTATKEYPIGVFRDGHIQFAPKDLAKVLFTYLRYPKAPLFTYDIINDAPVFVRSGATYPAGNNGAVDIELPLICSKQISAMIAQRMGFFTRDMPLIQTTESVKAKGI